MRLIHAMAKMVPGKMSDAIKDSFGPDYLLWFGYYYGCRYRSRPMMGCNMVMMMMMTVDVMVMGYANFILGGERR